MIRLATSGRGCRRQPSAPRHGRSCCSPVPDVCSLRVRNKRLDRLTYARRGALALRLDLPCQGLFFRQFPPRIRVTRCEKELWTTQAACSQATVQAVSQAVSHRPPLSPAPWRWVHTATAPRRWPTLPARASMCGGIRPQAMTLPAPTASPWRPQAAARSGAAGSSWGRPSGRVAAPHAPGVVVAW